MDSIERLSARPRSVLSNRNKLIALAVLGTMILAMGPSTFRQVKASSDMSGFKRASLYEHITDYWYPYSFSQYPNYNRSLSDVINMFRETRTQVVFRSFFMIPGNLYVAPSGKTFLEEYGDATKGIKQAISDIHIMGAISCRLLTLSNAVWPNRRAVTADELQQMTWILPNGTVPPSLIPGRHRDLDIMKPLARDFIVEWTKLQVDAGVDSIHFDEPQYVATRKMNLGLLKDVSEYNPYWKDIVDRVKAYARDRYGRELLVNANNNRVPKIGEETKTPPPWPFQDMLSVSFRQEDFDGLSIQENWTFFKKLVRDVYGRDLPIFAFLDWGAGTATPLARFARLSASDQNKMLRLLQQSCVENGVVFVYPIHGGYIYQGNVLIYDCVAQGTYATIKELASSLSATESTRVSSTLTISSSTSVTATTSQATGAVSKVTATTSFATTQLYDSAVVSVAVGTIVVVAVIAALLVSKRSKKKARALN